MGTLNRAIQRIKKWFTTPARNIGTGMPTRRTMLDPIIAQYHQPRSPGYKRPQYLRAQNIAIARRRAANKVARRSRRINCLVAS